jgi:hypothetical protein
MERIGAVGGWQCEQTAEEAPGLAHRLERLNEAISERYRRFQTAFNIEIVTKVRLTQRYLRRGYEHSA